MEANEERKPENEYTFPVVLVNSNLFSSFYLQSHFKFAL